MPLNGSIIIQPICKNIRIKYGDITAIICINDLIKKRGLKTFTNENILNNYFPIYFPQRYSCNIQMLLVL